MKVTREMLKYKDEYSWTATGGDDPEITGKPDAPRFSRAEGYEVLPMIQNIVDELSISSPKLVHTIEDKIKKLPSDMQSRDMVFEELKLKMIFHISILN